MKHAKKAIVVLAILAFLIYSRLSISMDGWRRYTNPITQQAKNLWMQMRQLAKLKETPVTTTIGKSTAVFQSIFDSKKDIYTFLEKLNIEKVNAIITILLEDFKIFKELTFQTPLTPECKKILEKYKLETTEHQYIKSLCGKSNYIESLERFGFVIYTFEILLNDKNILEKIAYLAKQLSILIDNTKNVTNIISRFSSKEIENSIKELNHNMSKCFKKISSGTSALIKMSGLQNIEPAIEIMIKQQVHTDLSQSEQQTVIQKAKQALQLVKTLPDKFKGIQNIHALLSSKKLSDPIRNTNTAFIIFDRVLDNIAKDWKQISLGTNESNPLVKQIQYSLSQNTTKKGLINVLSNIQTILEFTRSTLQHSHPCYLTFYHNRKFKSANKNSE